MKLLFESCGVYIAVVRLETCFYYHHLVHSCSQSSYSTASKMPNITLYTTQTPNGNKASIALEELGLPYKVYQHSFAQRTQKEPWYLAINPNGRIPAITDTFSDGESIKIWESGNILKYLVEQYDPEFKLWYPPKTRESYELFSWVPSPTCLISYYSDI